MGSESIAHDTKGVTLDLIFGFCEIYRYIYFNDIHLFQKNHQFEFKCELDTMKRKKLSTVDDLYKVHVTLKKIINVLPKRNGKNLPGLFLGIYMFS